MDPTSKTDILVDEILTIFAREARIDRQLLQLDASTEDLGVASLDVALAIFELEDRYAIRLPELAPDAPSPTVGELVQQVLTEIEQGRVAPRATAAGAAPGASAQAGSALADSRTR